MNKYIPFYTENNSHNLPFYLVKDNNENDVIYINSNNIIYTNEKNTDMSYQILLYNYCLNQGICYIYKIENDTSVIKKVKDSDIYYYLCDKNNELYIYYQNINDEREINIHANGSYLCLTSNCYQDYLGDIVFGYDISKEKILDYNDSITHNNIYKYLIEVRRCRFDTIYSILRGKCYLDDINILYNFLSFILDYQVDEKNCASALDEAKKIILSKYPEVKNIYIKNYENINSLYNINKFCFHRDYKKIKNLKYIR